MNEHERRAQRCRELRCSDCGAPRNAGTLLCSDCQRRAVANLDRATTTEPDATDAMRLAIVTLSAQLASVVNELRELRRELADVCALGTAALRGQRKPHAPGVTLPGAPPATDSAARVGKLELD